MEFDPIKLNFTVLQIERQKKEAVHLDGLE